MLWYVTGDHPWVLYLGQPSRQPSVAARMHGHYLMYPVRASNRRPSGAVVPVAYALVVGLVIVGVAAAGVLLRRRPPDRVLTP